MGTALSSGAAFLLERMQPGLASYTPPAGSVAPSGDWELAWDCLGVPFGQLMGNGRLRVARAAAGPDAFALTVNSRRRAKSGYSFFLSARLECRGDEVGSVRTWSASSKMAAGQDAPPYLNSGLEKTGRIDGRSISLITGGDRREWKVPGRCAAKWCLLEAVQRLPRRPGPPAAFSLLDEVDEVRPVQELRYRSAEPVGVAGKTVELAVFEHLGEGVIPTTYWVDAGNRVLFAISGIELLVLRESRAIA